jgi:hypothetical protein
VLVLAPGLLGNVLALLTLLAGSLAATFVISRLKPERHGSVQ